MGFTDYSSSISIVCNVVVKFKRDVTPFRNLFFMEISYPQIKVGLSPSKKFCFIFFNKNPLKMVKTAYLSLFVVKIFKLLS